MIFLSYRSADGRTVDGIAEALTREFGQDFVFRDRSRMFPGNDIAQKLTRALKDASVVVTVIGPRWSRDLRPRVTNARGEIDYVHLKMKTTLERRLPIVPVLIGDARPLTAGELPRPLKGLASIHAVTFRGGPHTAEDLTESARQEVARALQGYAAELGRIEDGTDAELEVLLTHTGIAVSDASFAALSTLKRHPATLLVAGEGTVLYQWRPEQTRATVSLAPPEVGAGAPDVNIQPF